ncbi:MAG: penicillin-binding protein activator [Alphaproteobacteria bacterium]
MRQLFNHWPVLCLLLGVAACGGTVPSAPVSVVGKSADPAAISKQQPDVPDKSPSIENQTATGDELAMVRSPVTPPQPKPRTDPSLVIKPGDVSEMAAESVTEKLAPEDSTTTLDVAEAEATEKPFTEQNTDDVINNIIWKIQSEVARKPKEPEAKVPEGQDPSLADDALEAAFALLAQKAKPAAATLPEREWSAKKAEGVTRIALLLPVTGVYQKMGEELRKGAELALFTARNPTVELMVFDTMGGQRGRRAAEEAVAAESDIMIGPLFSGAVAEARAVAGAANIPMLLLSNNALVASSGSWLMGYLPEQQLDLLLGYAIADGRQRFAIIAEDSAFGKRLATHAQRRLVQSGLPAEDSMVLREQALDSEDLLKRAIRKFSRYVAPVEDEVVAERPPVFDALIFAGGAEFALRTAPVLAYYDLGSDAVMYLGNAQWNQRQILSEPSLQKGLFAFRPSNTDDQFVAKWTAVWPDRPGLLSRLSFDAVALAEVLAGKDRSKWQKELLSSVGFNGFSGAFRFLPGGGNVRAFELRQITNGRGKLLQSAPDKI